jgi:magnesium-transporting ATPase (P-type)
MLWRVGFVGLLLLLGAGLLFLQEQARGETTLEFARTVAVNALVMGEIFYLLNVRFLHRPAYTSEGLLGSPAVLIAIGICLGFQVLFTHVPFMNFLFGTEPLDAEAWMRCAAAGLLVFVAVELEKLVFRRRIQARAAGGAAGEPNSEKASGGERTVRRTMPGSEPKRERRQEKAK